MNLLSVHRLSKGFGDEPLFTDLSFGLSRGDKAAIVAVNGAGKTTLMRLLAGKEEPDGGEVAFAEGIRVGYLEQYPTFNQQLSIAELAFGSDNPISRLKASYEAHLRSGAASVDLETYNKKLHELTVQMDAVGAWDYERRLGELLTRFGLHDTSRTVGSLSGGQLKRLSLAMVIIDKPDLLLLDEPTNHLDIETIEWLEKYLSQVNITFLMVTHDRYFLDRVCTHIYELFDRKLFVHKGNFSYYLEKSAQREEALRIEAEKAGQLLKQETEWMRRMPQARTTKSKSRIAAYYELKEKVSAVNRQQEIKLEVQMQRMGSKILEMRNVSKSFGDVVILDHFDYMFTKGERIGVVGPNGVGKTTFLNLITGHVSPDGGRVLAGDTMVFGYYTQDGLQFDESKRIIDVVKEIADIIELGNGSTLTAQQMLTRFLFPPKKQNQLVSSLSGGEKRRLHLLTVLMRNPNFLILDEPTNDLDLVTLQALEDFIRQYRGCLIMVTHDRYFMDQVVDQLFVFEGQGRVRGFVGTYTEYREMAAGIEHDERKRETPTKASVSRTDKTSKANKRSFKEQKEYERLEQEIAALEIEKSEITVALSDSNRSYSELQSLSERIAEIDIELDNKTMRWLELDEAGK
ncbi:MAG TPA: ABC-F family ATP-binding cassette domain-containing protein [Bacteroidales bacterium]|nr:ABC-F family ATP-binding cassette domain-containing protein [Bacteroidales bacterium]